MDPFNTTIGPSSRTLTLKLGSHYTKNFGVARNKISQLELSIVKMFGWVHLMRLRIFFYLENYLEIIII